MKWFPAILVWTIRIAVYGSLVIIVCFALYIPPSIHSGGQEQVAKLFFTQDTDNPLFKYKLATGHYPTTAQGLTALIQAPDGVAGWHGPYLKIPPPQTHVIVRNGIPHRYTTTSISTNDLLTDPWRNPYHYRYPGLHNPNTYDVWSSGPDGIDGTPDDIGNW